MANFTRGPVRYQPVEGEEHLAGEIITINNDPICRMYGVEVREFDGNVATIVNAFNSATKAEEMGFDGQKAIEMLPELIKAMYTIAYESIPLYDSAEMFLTRVAREVMKNIPKEKNNG